MLCAKRCYESHQKCPQKCVSLCKLKVLLLLKCSPSIIQEKLQFENLCLIANCTKTVLCYVHTGVTRIVKMPLELCFYLANAY